MTAHDYFPAPTPSGHNWHIAVNIATPQSGYPVAVEWRQISDMVSVKVAGQVVTDIPWDEFMERITWLVRQREQKQSEASGDERAG